MDSFRGDCCIVLSSNNNSQHRMCCAAWSERAIEQDHPPWKSGTRHRVLPFPLPLDRDSGPERMKRSFRPFWLVSSHNTINVLLVMVSTHANSGSRLINALCNSHSSQPYWTGRRDSMTRLRLLQVWLRAHFLRLYD